MPPLKLLGFLGSIAVVGILLFLVLPGALKPLIPVGYVLLFILAWWAEFTYQKRIIEGRELYQGAHPLAIEVNIDDKSCM